MRYSVLSGGKRVRPFLVIETAKLFGTTEAGSMLPACAVEMIHAYSLVHDDLPAMDNDDFRRGKKTCHKKYDEATAILVGDALLTQAFQIIADSKKAKPETVRQTIRILSSAAGAMGMVGGQAADMMFQKNRGTLAVIDKVNRLKTGALIRASVEMGAVWAGAGSLQLKNLSKYGECIGQLFQLIDDILDGDGYVSLIGPEKTNALALKTKNKALEYLKPFKNKAQTLNAFTEFLFERKS
ncbi:MAG: polyprenyl synthetase family protein [Candidatus Omnitrophica bacterium]|nr:polyprenyl synthetase family protein [Candidatus Omnitrophota bacterium]